MLGEAPVKLLDWKPPSTQTIDGLSFNTKFFILCQPSPYRNLDDAKGLPPTSLHIPYPLQTTTWATRSTKSKMGTKKCSCHYITHRVAIGLKYEASTTYLMFPQTWKIVIFFSMCHFFFFKYILCPR